MPVKIEDYLALIRGIVERKFRTRLLVKSGSDNTERAWEVYQSICLELGEKFAAVEAGKESLPHNPAAWITAVAYNTISDEWRRGNKDRSRLKARLRRFLTQQPGFALWPGSEEPSGRVQYWCGFAGWEGQSVPLAPGERVAAVTRQPVKSLDLMKAENWRELLDAVFEELGGPVRLDTLVWILVPWFGFTTIEAVIEDEQDESPERPEPVSPTPGSEREAISRGWLQWVWRTTATFDRRWLVSFFLNLPMDNRTKERGEIEVFPLSGVASMAQIGERLALSADEYFILRRELAGEPESLPESATTPELRLAALWRHLPLSDDRIGAMLGLTRQQVTNLRTTMIARLNKMWMDAAKPQAGRTPSS
jgi:DNA-directed RNA polymerase specialized sigma24 family protein